MKRFIGKGRCATLLAIAFAIAQTATAHALEVSSEAIIDAPQAEVWYAFTSRAGVESWMVAKASIDLRLGGLMRTQYRKESELGDDGTIENTFLSFDAPRMYSMRISKPPATFPFANAWKRVWTVVYFDPVETGRTRVTIRMLGYGDDKESQEMRAFFTVGNQYTLDMLAAKYKAVLPAKKPPAQ